MQAAVIGPGVHHSPTKGGIRPERGAGLEGPDRLRHRRRQLGPRRTLGGSAPEHYGQLVEGNEGRGDDAREGSRGTVVVEGEKGPHLHPSAFKGRLGDGDAPHVDGGIRQLHHDLVILRRGELEGERAALAGVGGRRHPRSGQVGRREIEGLSAGARRRQGGAGDQDHERDPRPRAARPSLRSGGEHAR